MSTIGRKQKEQTSGRVLLAEYEITSSTAHIDIEIPFMSGGSQYRQHEFEFVSLAAGSNGDLKFALQRQYSNADNAPTSASSREYITASQFWNQFDEAGTNQSNWLDGSPGWNEPRHQWEVDGGNQTPPRDYVSIMGYATSYYYNKTMQGKLTFWNLCFNDDRTRWVAEMFGHKHTGSTYQGQIGVWSQGHTGVTDRIRRIRLTVGGNFRSGRIFLYGLAKSGGATLRDGSSPEKAGESATELFKNGVRREGSYWLNNLYTGHVPRMAYCKFSMNEETSGSGNGRPQGDNYHDYGGGEGNTSTYHMQRWSPRHMPGAYDTYYNYGNNASNTGLVADGSEITTCMDGTGGNAATNWTAYKTSSSSPGGGNSSNSGGKLTMRLGIQARQMSNHTLFAHRYLRTTGSGTWDMECMLDQTATTDNWGGAAYYNYGNTYGVLSSAYIYGGGMAAKMWSFNAGISSAGSHRMSRISFYQDGNTRIAMTSADAGSGTIGTGHVWGSPISTMWENVRKWDQLDPASANAADDDSGYGALTQSYFLALSIKTQSSSSEAQGYYEFWVHIP